MGYRITVLGSGTIIPSARRKPTAIMFETDSEVILFDCGPSIPQAIVVNGFSLSELDRIFITHFHPDHTLGLGHIFSAVINDAGFPERKEFHLYAPEGIGEFIRKWHDLYPSNRKATRFFNVNEVHAGDRIEFSDLVISTGRAEHGAQKALMYRAEYKGSTFVFTGDTEFNQSVVEFAKGADILAAECSFPDDNPAAGHMTPSDVALLASRCGALRLLILHMYPSQREEDMKRSIRRRYDGEIIVGEDGMTLETDNTE
ncbi:MAG: MBL fold metallo-hydrolase [Candidatus Krumholzibacteriota bacterium]|nr:MBL fold metallo-hydrolase [Candidatus Krumholzibacteriota bacterium]